ncbi:MAG TPA: hypothetical protein PK760_12705, partial [Flavobacteriales bacterium]|nr:hypothetical protein [Flavobacteriales bacterium]
MLSPQSQNMDQPNEFNPRLSDAMLVVSSEADITIAQVKHATRMVFARYYPFPTAMMMAHALNWNYYNSRDRRHRAILITADNSPLADAILLDLYARLFRQSNEICIKGRACSVTLEGRVDQNRLNALSQHYFWISSAFEGTINRDGQRYLLN